MYMDAKSSQGYETTEQEAAEWLLEGGIRRKTGGAKCLTPDGFFLKSSIAQGTLGWTLGKKLKCLTPVGTVVITTEKHYMAR